MRRVRLWSLVALAVIAAGAVLVAWWSVDLRWRPHAIVRNQQRIGAILAAAGWVSPRLPGPKLYIVTARGCADCVAFEETQLDTLRAGGVDTRMIMIAPADANGRPGSSAAERSTVAALWLDRDWALLQRWLASPAATWAAPGLPPADGDLARTAVIAAGRKSVDDLRPLLRANGVTLAFPTMIWWTRSGAMHACACRRPPAWRKMERELGA